MTGYFRVDVLYPFGKYNQIFLVVFNCGASMLKLVTCLLEELPCAHELRIIKQESKE
jgi:hypothetical protein